MTKPMTLISYAKQTGTLIAIVVTVIITNTFYKFAQDTYSELRTDSAEIAALRKQVDSLKVAQEAKLPVVPFGPMPLPTNETSRHVEQPQLNRPTVETLELAGTDKEVIPESGKFVLLSDDKKPVASQMDDRAIKLSGQK